MKQTAFTIVTPIRAGEIERLGALLDEIGSDIKDNPHLRFGQFERLHYASLLTVIDAGAQPVLIFEGNLDGPPEVFLRQLVEEAGAAVDTIYGHCLDYPAPGSRAAGAVVHYLASHDIGADTFYVAWPGRRVSEIFDEQHLRDRIGEMLDKELSAPDGARTTVALRAALQEGVRADPSLAWAGEIPPKPLFVRQGSNVLVALALPPLAAGLALLRSAFARSSGRTSRWMARLILAGVVGAVAWIARRLLAEEEIDADGDRQRHPDWQTAYARWSDQLGDLVQRENVGVQNHMASVTRIKDGWFRLRLLQVVLWVINLFARLRYNKGKLGSIPSIHFGRWVISPDRRHLIFLTNFDGSWESYLSDFIDLSASGLTAIWANTDNAVGCPQARWLVTRGARDEPRFKAYARSSQVRTQAWYSAYPDLTVSNIANNMALREGLFADLDEPAAEAWLRRL